MAPDQTIEAREEHDVTVTVALVAAVSRIGATRLLLAQMDWDRLFTSANPPGAPAPGVARATLTRQAIRDTKARRAAARANASIGHARAFAQLVKACA